MTDIGAPVELAPCTINKGVTESVRVPREALVAFSNFRTLHTAVKCRQEASVEFVRFRYQRLKLSDIVPVIPPSLHISIFI